MYINFNFDGFYIFLYNVGFIVHLFVRFFLYLVYSPIVVYGFITLHISTESFSLNLKDTVKVVQDGFIADTPDRSTLWLTQTPQVFRADVLKEAYRQPFRPSFTDDASVVEAAGHAVELVPGERFNVKVTTPDDLALAEKLLTLSSFS